jgi:hypothetical protein
VSTAASLKSTKGRGSLGPLKLHLMPSSTTSSLHRRGGCTLPDDSERVNRVHPCTARLRPPNCCPQPLPIPRHPLSGSSPGPWLWPKLVVLRLELELAPWLFGRPPSPRPLSLSSGALSPSCSRLHGRSMHPAPTRRISFRRYRLLLLPAPATILSEASRVRRLPSRESNAVM